MELVSDQSIRSVQYYAMAKKWANDLDHFSRESRFLHNLFEDYFLVYHSKLYHQELRDLESRLDALEKEEEEIAKKMEQHLKNLEAMVDGKVAEDTEKFEQPQIDMEMRVNGLIDRFCKMKRELYDFVEESQSAY